MANIAVFASGNGSNFEALARKFKKNKNHKIVLLLCDRQKAFVRERAKIFNIKEKMVNFLKNDKQSVESEILDILTQNKIDIIFLAGFMRVLSPDFLQKCHLPIINIHPSILPKHKGAHAIEQAYNSEDLEIGITIHFVNEEVDGGEIIFQEIIPLERHSGINYVEDKIHKLEHKWYPEIAQKICDTLNK